MSKDEDMMSKYHEQARASSEAKLRKMLGDNDLAKEATHYASLNSDQVTDRKIVPQRASGGRVKHEDEAADKRLIKKMLKDEERKEDRLDRRPRRANGGKVKGARTNVNVIISPKPDAAPMPMPIAAPAAAAPAPAPRPPMPPMMPPGLGAAGMPPMPMRKKGGRVKMTAGAGDGVGRLQKIALQKQSYP